jgi:F420-non-reducing hydrogenase iron-sulfur subunit
MTKVITLMCERSVELDSSENPDVHVIKFPCSGMIQPLMVEAALKSGADGVVVCGCQLGDCYYREGNRMIRERLLGGRPPGLKKTVDRRRVEGLWLSRPQKHKFIEAVKEFIARIKSLPAPAETGIKDGNTTKD